jgi:arabinogalactan oligomer / maltooligosaccharide transport system permease protein
MSSQASSKNTWQEGSGMVQSRNEQVIGLAVRMTVVVIAVLFALFPVFFIVLSAFNPAGTLRFTFDALSNVTADQLFANFDALVNNPSGLYPFWQWIRNSFIVAVTSTVLTVLVASLSAYSFSRFRFWGRRSLLLGVLLIQVFPNILAIVAIFLMMDQIKNLASAIPEALPFLAGIDWSWLALFGLDSLGGLILIYLGGAMGVNVWLMKGFFDTIPREIDESAMVDGATHWQTFWMLIFPLVRPILAVVGVLAFIGTFNEFVMARLILRDKENWTLMVGLFNFINADFNRDWGKFAAGALLASIPVVAVYLSLQRQIVGGLTAGAVKG